MGDLGTVEHWECTGCGAVVSAVPARQPSPDIRYVWGHCTCTRPSRDHPLGVIYRRAPSAPAAKPRDEAGLQTFLRSHNTPAKKAFLRTVLDTEPVAVWELERALSGKHQTVSAVASTLLRDGVLVRSGIHKTPDGVNADALSVTPSVRLWLEEEGT